jgi:YidC/Oxa1 family membrane protein insertase
MSAVFGVPVDAAYHLVLALGSVFAPVFGSLAAVAGIIVFTMAVRLLVMPLSFRALRGQAALARLAPQVQALRKRYARQPERLQREVAALYQREGTSMFAGFWPILAQWPVFSVLYLLFRSPHVAGTPNLLLSRDLFGVPLGAHWPGGAGLLSARSTVFLAVFAILALACWLLGSLARRAAAGPSAQPSGAPALIGKILPFVTVIIAAFAPLAAAIYLAVSTSWSTAERQLFLRSTAGQSGGVLARLRRNLGNRDRRP